MARKRSSDKLAVQNATKTLLANIRFASIDTPIKTVTITSSRPNEGKTTVAHNLALGAATGGRHVLLVECDMRHRSLANQIGVHGREGLYGVLSGHVDLDDAIVSTSQAGLDFLDVEPGIPNPADVIASKRFRKLVRTLRADYDLVVFDTPPVGGFVDAAELAALTDGTLFVVRENFTRREVALDALEQLRKAGANVLGSVLNCCEHSSSGYYDYYYHDYEQVAENAEPVEIPREAHARPQAAPMPAAEASDDDEDVDDDPFAVNEAKVAKGAHAAKKASPSETSAFMIAASESSVYRATQVPDADTMATGAQAPLPAGGAQPMRPAKGASQPYVPQKNPYTR